jgi:PKD repeat protein
MKEKKQMKAVLTLKPVTDKKGNVWHAGQILGMSSAQAKTFVAAKNGLDLEGTNFANAATPDNTAAPVTAPTTSDFSLAMLGVKTAAGGTAPTPPPVEVVYTITMTPDATDPLKLNAEASPKNPGTFKFGDGTSNVNATTGAASHTYAAAGTYSVTFIPVDGAKAVTTSVTVTAPVVEEPAPVETIPAEETPKV